MKKQHLFFHAALLVALASCNRQDVTPQSAVDAKQNSKDINPQCKGPNCINWANFRISSAAPYLQGQNIVVSYWNSANGDDVFVLKGGNGYSYILDENSGEGRIGMDNNVHLRIPTELPNGTYYLQAYSRSQPTKVSPTVSFTLSGGNYKDQNFVTDPSKYTTVQTFVSPTDPIYVQWDNNAINSGQGFVTIAVREQTSAGTIWRPGCYAINSQYAGGYSGTYYIQTKYLFPNTGSATVPLNSLADPSIFANGMTVEFIVSDASSMSYGLSGQVTIQ